MSSSSNSSSSGRKKAARDKTPSDDAVTAATTRAPRVLLTSERACVRPRNAYLPYSNATNAVCARAHGSVSSTRAYKHNNKDDDDDKAVAADAAAAATMLREAAAEVQTLAARDDDDGMDHVAAWLVRCGGDARDSTAAAASPAPQQRLLSSSSSREALRRSWRHHVATHLPSPLCYPHHTLYLHDTHVQGGSGDGDDERTTDVSPSRRAREVAAFVVRVLHASTDLANDNNDDNDDVSRALRDDCCAMLGHALYATGYDDAALAREQHDVAFAHDRNEDDDAAAACCDANGCCYCRCRRDGGLDATRTCVSRCMTCVRHVTSRHIAVCCSDCYYTLRVLDDATRAVCRVDALAAALDAVRTHAAQWRATAAAAPPHDVGAAVHDDVCALHRLLSRMSGLHDALRIDVHRRLRDAGEANAYALDRLASALFTLVLDEAPASACSATDDTSASTSPRSAQWLHSVLSVYAPWPRDGVFALRAHATVVSSASLQYFAHRLAAVSHTRLLSDNNNDNDHGGDEHDADASSDAWRRASQQHHLATYNNDNSDKDKLCSVELCAGLHFLDLWLPLKHRMALRPYAACVPTPRWRAVTLRPTTSCSSSSSDDGDGWCVADVCLATIAAVTAALHAPRSHCDDDDDNDSNSLCDYTMTARRRQRRPRVLFALQHPHHTAPSAVLLYTCEVEHYLQTLPAATTTTTTTDALRQTLPLHTRETRARVRAAALHSIAARLRACAQSPLPLYWLAAQTCAAQSNDHDADADGDDGGRSGSKAVLPTVDVCITAGVLPPRRDGTASHRRDGNDATRQSLTMTALHSDVGVPACVYVHCGAHDVRRRPRQSCTRDDACAVAQARVDAVAVGARAQHTRLASAVYAHLRHAL